MPDIQFTGGVQTACLGVKSIMAVASSLAQCVETRARRPATPSTFIPFVGCDNETYNNACEAAAGKNFPFSREGECLKSEDVCNPRSLLPSRRHEQCGGALRAPLRGGPQCRTRTAQVPDCQDDSDCSDDKFCQKKACGTRFGTCETRPDPSRHAEPDRFCLCAPATASSLNLVCMGCDSGSSRFAYYGPVQFLATKINIDAGERRCHPGARCSCAGACEDWRDCERGNRVLLRQGRLRSIRGHLASLGEVAELSRCWGRLSSMACDGNLKP